MSTPEEHLAVRPHAKMMEVLRNADAYGPPVHYYMIRGGSDRRNITVWEPGTVGDEYIKTYGHYHIGQLDETYWILHGEGVVLQQTLVLDNGQPVVDRVQSFRAIAVKAGDSVYMSPGMGHLVANVGATFLVTADDSPVNFGDVDPVAMPGHADYDMVKRMHGFAFYVIERESRPALVRNPRYREVRAFDAGGLAVVN